MHKAHGRVQEMPKTEKNYIQRYISLREIYADRLLQKYLTREEHHFIGYNFILAFNTKEEIL